MVATIAGIPVYNALVDDEGTGMLRVSLVDDPAIMTNFLAFDKDRKTITYRVADEERRLVFGVLMRADFPIYRNDPRFGEFYIVYTANTIRKMAEKYMAEDRQNNVDTMHDRDDRDGITLVQYFLKDTARGIAPEGFDEVADGSLFAEYHIENEEVWAKIKDGSYRGFSIEIVNDLVPEEDAGKVAEIIEETDGKFSSQEQHDMSKFARFKAGLARLLAQFGNVATDKGILAWEGDEDLKAGDEVFIEDSEGNRTPAPEGDYITTDAKTIRVADGKVAEIIDPEAEVDAAFGRKATDNGELIWDGEEDLKEGDAVFIEEEGERRPAPDGEYRTEDGKTIVVVEGRVAEIRDTEAEVAPEGDPAEDTEALRAENEALKAEVASLKEQIATLSRQPAAKPAHEEIVCGAARKTGIKGLDNLAKYFSA